MSAPTFNYHVTLGAMAQSQPKALDTLYYQEAPAMLSLAHSVLQRRVEAEEVLRESFILLWKNAVGYDPSLGDARAWIYSILRFRLQARLRKRQPNATQAAVTLPAISPNHQQHFTLALSEQEPVQQRAVILAYLQGKNYDQLSAMLGRPVAQLRIQVQQSLTHIAHQCLTQSDKLDSRQNSLIAEYALGLLSDSELRQAHGLMQHNDDAARLSLSWEVALLELVSFLPPIAPTPTGLAHIYRTLDLGVPERRDETDKTSPNAEANSAAPQAAVQSALKSPTVSTAMANENAAVESPVLQHSPQPLDKQSAPTPPSYSSLLRTDQTQPIEQPETKVEPEPASGNALSRIRQRRREAASKQNTMPAQSSASAPSNTLPPLSAPAAPPSLELSKNSISKLLWPSSCLALLLLSVVLAYQWYQEAQVPNVTVIEMQPVQGAILQAPGLSSSPAWSVTVDPQGNVLFVPHVHTDIQAGQSVQLWTQKPGQLDSLALGLIDPNRPITVPANLIGSLENGQIFEMTLEQEGGSTNGQPQGPVLYIGSMVNFGKLPAGQDSNKQVRHS